MTNSSPPVRGPFQLSLGRLFAIVTVVVLDAWLLSICPVKWPFIAAQLVASGVLFVYVRRTSSDPDD